MFGMYGVCVKSGEVYVVCMYSMCVWGNVCGMCGDICMVHVDHMCICDICGQGCDSI